MATGVTDYTSTLWGLYIQQLCLSHAIMDYCVHNAVDLTDAFAVWNAADLVFGGWSLIVARVETYNL
jgi:hypothetical protein